MTEDPRAFNEALSALVSRTLADIRSAPRGRRCLDGHRVEDDADPDPYADEPTDQEMDEAADRYFERAARGAGL